MTVREDDFVPDVLADRYASRAMVEIWSPRARVVLEREFWIAVMRAQRGLGVDIPEAAIAAYDAVKEQVDFDSIRERERVTRHDVKARIDEFCALAGHQHIHKGLTSRDLTENVEQLQIARSLRLLRGKYAGCLRLLAERVRQYRSIVVTGRTHNVAAQPTTLGKRLAMFGSEMVCAYRALVDLVERYPLRGLKGPVGTQLDLRTLLAGGAERTEALERTIAAELGFQRVLGAVGQVYPRSLDFDVVSVLFLLVAGPASFATTLRLMAGAELASEGFGVGQVGSSAMPHKMNARSCERIGGLRTVLSGYVTMMANLAGTQWNEGDVSCSVVRRVALPSAMFATDGLLETFATVVQEMEFFEAAVARERERVAPFLATTTILMEAVRRGAGREAAHAAIQEHAVAAARALQAGSSEPGLLDRLAGDPRIGLGRDELIALIADGRRFIGAAAEQVDELLAEVDEILLEVPEASGYRPDKIL